MIETSARVRRGPGRRNRVRPRPVLAGLMLFYSGVCMSQTDTLLIDDFNDRGGRAAYGTSWNGFTDRVMGGVSDMQAAIIDSDRGPALRIAGSVRLDNNGGFIQARLPLVQNRAPLDASDYDAVRIVVRGDPGPYYLHLRTPDTGRPWQYYRAELPVDSEWVEHTIPFDAFVGKSIRGTPDFSRLVSIAVVAYGEAFEARIDVAKIEFIRSR